MAMKQLVFMGSGDDTFGEMTTGFDYDGGLGGYPIAFRVSGKDDQGRPVAMLVIGQYCPAFEGADATGWMIGVARAHDHDDVPLPSWPMRFERSDAPYSPRLVIEVPDDVTVETAMTNER